MNMLTTKLFWQRALLALLFIALTAFMFSRYGGKEEVVLARHPNHMEILTDIRSHNVSITGWSLEIGERRFTLGGASSIPKHGAINDESPIVLSDRASIIVSSGESPIGVSFRENMCTPFFGKYQGFEPQLTLGGSEGVSVLEKYPDYTTCVASESGKAGFYLDIWRLYLDLDETPWTNSRLIKLVDQEGKLLATYIN
jgi:hypothetical protein